ncbi:MAG: tetratricopeptide repeat protein [Lishizhenia sp.]
MSEEITREEIIEQFKGNKVLKGITIAVGVLVVGVLIYFGYNTFVAKPNEMASNEQNARGIMLLEKDSLDLAIEELEFQANEYNGYTGGEISQFGLASAYFKKGEFELALSTLEDVNLDDIYLSTMAIGMQGDCYSEMEDFQNAVDKYVLAAEKSKNELTTPMYLFKAGLNAEAAKDFSKAAEFYNRINDEFSTYASQNGIEKYISRAENSSTK